MGPLRPPRRRWVALAGTAIVLVSTWLLLAPITAVYVTSDISSSDHLAPHGISTMYSWWTSDETLVYSDAGFTATHIVKGVRLGCGNSFTVGADEQQQAPDGPSVCAGVERPRRIIGLSTLALGILALITATRLAPEPERNHYRMPRNQRRTIMRGR